MVSCAFPISAFYAFITLGILDYFMQAKKIPALLRGFYKLYAIS
jgi:hypothetical protein